MEHSHQTQGKITNRIAQTFIRLQIDYPDDYHVTDNSKFQAFIENYRRYLSRHGLDSHHVWITESNNNHISHQLNLLVNANAVYAEFNIDKVRELWCYTLGVLPLNCNKLVTRIKVCPCSRIASTDGIISRDDNYAISDVLGLTSSMDSILQSTSHEGFRRYGCSLLPDKLSWFITNKSVP